MLVAAEVVDHLDDRDAAARAGAKALVDKEVSLDTTGGVRKGRVRSADDDGIALVKEIKVGGRVVGGSESRIGWDTLTPESVERLARNWSPGGAAGAIARALVALERADPERAREALGDAGEGIVALVLREEHTAADATSPEDPAAELSMLEKRAGARRMTVAEELCDLVAEVDQRVRD